MPVKSLAIFMELKKICLSLQNNYQNIGECRDHADIQEVIDVINIFSDLNGYGADLLF